MLIEFPYNRQNAVTYVRKWALSRNPLFSDFAGSGGDCTNFVSQGLFAGSGVMDFTPTFGWYYRSLANRAPAWSGVDELYGFLTGSGDFEGMAMGGPFATLVRNRREIEAGDVIQLANSQGEFYHTLMISGFAGNDILVCAHTDDALDRPLSSYNYASLRVLHINGVYFDVPLEESFQALSDGTAIEYASAILKNAQAADEI